MKAICFGNRSARLILAFAICGVVALLGCSRETGPPRAEVTGVVTLDGEPVKGAIVEFTPEVDGVTTSYGGTNKKGHFRMLFDTNRT